MNDPVERIDAEIEELEQELAGLDQFGEVNVDGMTDLNEGRAEKFERRIEKLRDKRDRIVSERGF